MERVSQFRHKKTNKKGARRIWRFLTWLRGPTVPHSSTPRTECTHVTKTWEPTISLTSQPFWAAPGGSSERTKIKSQSKTKGGFTFTKRKKEGRKRLKDGERERQICVGGEYRQRWCSPPLLWEQPRHCRYQKQQKETKRSRK